MVTLIYILSNAIRVSVSLCLKICTIKILSLILLDVLHDFYKDYIVTIQYKSFCFNIMRSRQREKSIII